MFFSTRLRVAALALGVVVGLSGLGPMALAQRPDDDDGNGNGGDTTEQDFEFDFDFDVDAIDVELGDITIRDLFDAITLEALTGDINVLNGSNVLSGNSLLNGNSLLSGNVLSPALLNCVGGAGGPDCNLLSGNTLGDVIGGDVLPVTVGDVLGGGILSGNDDVLSPALLNCVAFGPGPDCNLLSGIGVGDVLGGSVVGDVLGGNTVGNVLSGNTVVDAFTSICSAFDDDDDRGGSDDQTVDCTAIVPVLVGLFGNAADVTATATGPLVDAAGALADNTATVTGTVTGPLVDVSDSTVDVVSAAVTVGNNFARNLIDASRTRVGPVNNLARDVLENVDVTIEAIINDVLNGSIF